MMGSLLKGPFGTPEGGSECKSQVLAGAGAGAGAAAAEQMMPVSK
jgi:hypothetical protein